MIPVEFVFALYALGVVNAFAMVTLFAEKSKHKPAVLTIMVVLWPIVAMFLLLVMGTDHGWKNRR